MGLGTLRRKLAEQWGEQIVRFVPNTQQEQLSQHVDWSRTQAYSAGYIGQIYLNLQGRDPQGIVMPGKEAQGLKNELRERLLAWRHPIDHQPVVDEVAFKDELYSGPYLDSAPDLVLSMRNLSYITRGQYQLANGNLFTAPRTSESGSHRQDGILLISGDGFVWEPEKTVHISDLAPTILHIMGCAIPADMDGEVRFDLFAKDSPFAQTVSTIDQPTDKHDDFELSEEEEESIRQRLEGLGYLV
jgi:predicted AlkP superfamily phosphohydrolase/phosphomutase